MQDADDLDLVGMPTVKNKIGRLDQHTRIRRNVRLGYAGLRKVLQNADMRFDAVILPVGRDRVVCSDCAPDIEKLATRTDGQANAELLFLRRIELTASDALQFSKIELAGIAARNAFVPGPPQIFDLFRFTLFHPLHEAKRLPHDFARRAIAPALDLGLDHSDKLGG